MKTDWKLPKQFEDPAAVASRRVKEVLLEYDGPQMAVLLDANGEYLALAVDQDESLVRWLQAPISKLELEALLIGAQPVRDVFKKSTVTVVDYPQRSEIPQSVYRVDRSLIPDAVLPRRGVIFPVSEAKAAPKEVPVLRLAGQGAARDGVTLAQLSAVAGTLHEVWTAITQHVFKIPNPRPFSAFAAGEGSLALSIHADDVDLFERVVREYEGLVRASDDPAALEQLLADKPQDVVAKYEKHLNVLEKQRAEVLAEWRTGAVYLGHDVAESALESYPSGPVVPAPVTVPRTHRGYFEGFWPKGSRRRFGFYDIDSNESFEGRIGRGLKVDWLRHDPLTLGRAERKYQITVSEQIGPTGEVLGRTLLDYAPID